MQELKEKVKGCNILGMFVVGSKFYGVNDEQSDTDAVVIVDDKFGLDKIQEEILVNENKYSFHVLTNSDFINELKDCEPLMLETLMSSVISFMSGNESLSLEYNGKKYSMAGFYDFCLFLNAIGVTPYKIRESLSRVSSNSFVKSKKKWNIENEKRIAIKSLFHSVRLLVFAINYVLLIKEEHCLFDQTEANVFYRDINNMINLGISFYDILLKYKKIHNQLSSELRLVAPKLN